MSVRHHTDAGARISNQPSERWAIAKLVPMFDTVSSRPKFAACWSSKRRLPFSEKVSFAIARY